MASTQKIIIETEPRDQCCAIITGRGQTRGHRCTRKTGLDDVRCGTHMNVYLSACRKYIWEQELAAYAVAAKLKERGLLNEWKAFAEERANEALNTQGKTTRELRDVAFPFGPMPEQFQMIQ